MPFHRSTPVRSALSAAAGGIARVLGLLRRMQLRDKLLIAIGSGVLLTLAISLQNIRALAAVQATVVQTNDMDLAAVTQLQNVQRDAYAMGRQVRLLAMAPGPAEREAARAALGLARTRVETGLPAAHARIFRPEAARALAEVEKRVDGYGELTARAAGLVQEGVFSADNEASRFILGADYRAAGAELDRALGALIQAQQEAAAAALAACAAMATTTQRLTSGILGLGLLASIGFGLLLMAQIRRPLEDLRHSIEALAQGRLDVEVPHTGLPNEIGAMARALRILQQGSQVQETQRWIKQGLLEIDQAVAGADSFPAFADGLAGLLARILGLVYLDVYVSEGASLRHVGGYACSGQEAERCFPFGEGLPGQAALDQRPLTLDLQADTGLGPDVGLGRLIVRHLHLAPICDRGQTLAVLEMGSRNGFDERQAAFLEVLLPAVAVKLRILGGAIAAQRRMEAARGEHA